MTKQYRIVVTDTNGKETSGASSELTDLELAQLHGVIKQLGSLEHLSIETYRGTVYFNIRHVVSVAIQELEL